jgi:hypothetical protein
MGSACALRWAQATDGVKTEEERVTREEGAGVCMCACVHVCMRVDGASKQDII